MAKPTQRQTMISQIFGQDQIKEVNKLVTADLTRLAEKLNKGLNNQDIRVALQGVSGLREEQALLQGRRTIQELIQAPNIINKDILNQQDEYFRRQNELLNEQMKRYSDVASLRKGVDTLVETTNVLASKTGSILDEVRSYFKSYFKFKSDDTRKKMEQLGIDMLTYEQFKELDSKGVFD